MKFRYGLAAALIIATILLTPFFEQLAYAKRGHYAIGGEYAPLVLSCVMSASIALKKDKKEN